MSIDGWNSVLVLGGIRSGKSAFAESLVDSAASVRYIATAVGGSDDPEWLARIEAHQARRPQSWTTEETGADPNRLIGVLAESTPDETLLVDDLGGWVAALLDPARQPNDDLATVGALAAAVRECPARLVVVSPEVGLSLVATTPVGRAFADALGTANQALAAACDRVVLIVAGQPAWLKSDNPSGTRTPAAPIPVPVMTHSAPAQPPEPDLSAPTSTPPSDSSDSSGIASGAASGVVIEAGMDIALPDHDSGPDATDRLATLDVPGTGVGVLSEVVEFAAATQGTANPRPWQAVRVLLLNGWHDGGAAAGDDPAESDRRAAEAQLGEGPLAHLAAAAGASVRLVPTAHSGAMEHGPVLDPSTVDAALRQGWDQADRAADEGVDLLVIGSCGGGTDAAAAAVLAATAGAEPVAVLARVAMPGGLLNDTAWMLRAGAVRDALHRIRQRPRGAKDILAELGGADIAVATGVLLGAAARRLPVLLDGPIGIAAGLVSRDLAPEARHWCLLVDHGDHPAVRHGADVLGLAPMLDLRLDLGEGTNALAALPLLTAVLGLTATSATHPELGAAPTDLMGEADDSFVATFDDIDDAAPGA